MVRIRQFCFNGIWDQGCRQALLKGRFSSIDWESTSGISMMLLTGFKTDDHSPWDLHTKAPGFCYSVARAQTFGYYHLSAGDLLREDRIFTEIETFGASMLSPSVSPELSGAQTRRLRVWPAHRELHQGPPSRKNGKRRVSQQRLPRKVLIFSDLPVFLNKFFSILEKWVLFVPSSENYYRFSCWFL